MAMEGGQFVLREGQDWLELRRIDPRGELWLVTGGTTGMPGDIVSLPRHQMFGGSNGAELSPFEAEIVVDSVTKAVLLPESGRPHRRARVLLAALEAAGLKSQARIVRERLGLVLEGRESKRNAA